VQNSEGLTNLTPDVHDRTSIDRIAIGCAVLMMLSGAYLDNVRGVLLPLLANNLDLSWGMTSWFLVTGHVAAVAASLITIKVLGRTSHNAVAMIGCALGLIVAVVAHFVTGLVSLVALALLMGAAMTTLGTMANLLTLHGTPPAFGGRVLSGMHMMYGIGSMCAPLLASGLLRQGLSWHWLIAGAAPTLIAATALLASRGKREAAVVERSLETPMRFRAGHALVLGVFCAYVVGEVLTAMWLSTWLVTVRNFATDETGPYVAAFFAVMGVTRFLSFLFASERHEKFILRSALLLPLPCFVVGYLVTPWAFALAGVVGPFFPLFMARVSRSFGDEWQKLTILAILCMQAILGVAHLVLGNLFDWIGANLAYMLPPVFLVLCAGLLGLYFATERRSALA